MEQHLEINISAGCSKKYCAYAIFFISTLNIADKRFKWFSPCWQWLLKVKFERLIIDDICRADITRGRIIGMLEEGRQITGVVLNSTSPKMFFQALESILKKWDAYQVPGGNRLCSTIASEYRYIVISIKKMTGALQLLKWQINFLLPWQADITKKCVQAFASRRIIRPKTCCWCPL